MKRAGWLEFEGPQTVRARQAKLLRDAVAYAAERSPHYRRALQADGVGPGDIRTTDDVRRLPITTKEDLQRDNQAFFCCDLREAADVVCTSGSTGARPLVHPLTRSDVDRLAYNEELSFLCAGAAPGDVFLVAVALDGFFIAGLAYYLGLRRVGACVLRAGPADFEQQCRAMARAAVTGLVGVPSNVIRLAQFCRGRGLPPQSLGLRKMVLIGETIRGRDLELNALGRRLAEAWPGAALMSTYGNTELATAYCECPAGRGAHSHPDLALTEVVDQDGRPLPAGEVGDLVVTTFGARGMPLLRYRTGDMTCLDPSPCRCGRTSPRIGPILGRRENMLKVRGVSTYPAAIEDAVGSLPEVADAVVVAEDGGDGTDAVALYVLPAAGAAPHLEERVCERVRERARITPRVVAATAAELEALEFGSGSRKARRFIDRRHAGTGVEEGGHERGGGA